MNEKCLVKEAREKCQCKNCKWEKELTEIAVQNYINWEIYNIYFKSIEEELVRRAWKPKEK